MEVAAKLSAQDERRRQSQVAATQVREREEADRLDRALRMQRRATLPAGIELRSRIGGAASGGDTFCASIETRAGQRKGPARRTIDTAELDLKRLERARKQGGDT